MKKIVFVTSNKGKLNSARSALDGVEVISYQFDIEEIRSDSIKDIAKDKVTKAYNLVKEPCIAMDAGFFIKAWNGFPSTYVNHALKTLNLEGLLKLMNGVKDRSCEFRECLVFFDGTNYEFFEGVVKGNMSNGIFGSEDSAKWSDLSYIFIPEGYDKTLAEFTEEDFVKFNSENEEDSLKQFSRWFTNIK